MLKWLEVAHYHCFNYFPNSNKVLLKVHTHSYLHPAGIKKKFIQFFVKIKESRQKPRQAPMKYVLAQEKNTRTSTQDYRLQYRLLSGREVVIVVGNW